MNFNNIVIGGRIAREPEIAVSAAGMAYTKFPIAFSDAKKNSIFMNCVSFGKKAEVIADNFHKGDPIIITGTLGLNKWTGKDGKENKSNQISISDFGFVEGRKREKPPEKPPEPERKEPTVADSSLDDDEIPF